MQEIDLLIPFAFGILFGAGGLGAFALSWRAHQIYVENTGHDIRYVKWVFLRLFNRKKLKG